MRERGYYSVRTGKHPWGAKLDLVALKKMIATVYRRFTDQDYFQEAFGYKCIDAGYIPGALGEEIDDAILIALRKEKLWPILAKIDNYTEDDVFDVLEFLYDNVSKPVDGYFHSYGDCGMHYSTFNRREGQGELRIALNHFLSAYGDGFQLSEEGEMLSMPENGMATLLEASLPQHDPNNVEARIEAATNRFRRHKSSLEDRKYALRDLADVLEFLRPKVSAVLTSKDEADLFNLANSFGIRHHNEKQKTSYDAAIWYSWMFYYYLATIHACLRLLAKLDKVLPT